MLLAALEYVSKSFATQVVLDGADFRISTGQKVALVGPNGSGKTTILRMLLGQEEISGGAVFLSKRARVGYVPQFLDYDGEVTVLDHVQAEHETALRRLREAEEALEASGSTLPPIPSSSGEETTDETDAEAEEREARPLSDADKLLKNYMRAREDYDRLEGDFYSQRARGMLEALGLGGKLNQKIKALSGGEKNVLALAEALLRQPDFLILDEPANHLDYMGVAWLEDFLKKFRGALLIISHNRYLLDRLVNGIWHLDRYRLKYYGGNYTDFRATRLREQLAQEADYKAAQKRLGRLQSMVQRMADQARNRADTMLGKRLRARRAQLERLREEAPERPEMREAAFRLRIEVEPPQGNIALRIRNYSKRFGERVLFDNASVDIACGERVGLLGPNGSGKTTLIRDIIAEGRWENPVLQIGPSLKVGYYAQEQDVFQGQGNLIDELAAVGLYNRKEAANLLGRFLFDWDDMQKGVNLLSGGERNRLQLARLLIQKPDFLILDEPTNHLDVLACEAVEDALADFEGTLLVISHDRYFLDKVATQVVEIRDQSLIPYAGGFSEFWETRKEETLATSGRVNMRARERVDEKEDKGRVEQERRDKIRLERSQKRAIVNLEKAIADSEEEKKKIEARMEELFAKGDHQEGAKAAKDLRAVQDRLAGLMEEWVQAGEE